MDFLNFECNLERTIETMPDGFVEQRVKVDRKKFESMTNGEESELGTADAFFGQLMVETGCQILWPSKLKAGTKSKKDPHVRIIGTEESVKLAKERIMDYLDTRKNRVTVKIDVAFTDHSHVIGKGGKVIQKVMDETGCHIHFPDSNRTNTVEKSNQVSIAGTSTGSEQARCRVRDLLPITFFFDVPITSSVQTRVLDPSSSVLATIQQTYSISITFRYGTGNAGGFGLQRNGFVTIAVKGSRSNVVGIKNGISMLLECLTGCNSTNVPVTTTIEIAAQHHVFVMGRGNCNTKAIFQQTGASIIFPDVNDSQTNCPGVINPIRKTTVVVKGSSFDSTFNAWKDLLGYLPLVLIFDLKENQEVDAAQITQLMEQLKVSIIIKPKMKQNAKSIMVRGAEKDSRVLFEVRRKMLGLDESEVPVCCERHGWMMASRLLSMFLPYATNSNQSNISDWPKRQSESQVQSPDVEYQAVMNRMGTPPQLCVFDSPGSTEVLKPTSLFNSSWNSTPKTSTTSSIDSPVKLHDVLHSMGLAKYTEVFKEHDIDVSTFTTLNDADLQELGISYFGRKKLLTAIVELKRVAKSEDMSLSFLKRFEAAPGAERRRRYPQGNENNPME